MSRGAQAIIALDALRHNFNQAKSLAPNAKCVPIIKANAYGHGLVPIAKALTEAAALGLACVDEALSLVEQGINQPLLILEGFLDRQELLLCSQYDFTVMLHHTFQVQLLLSNPLPKPLKVWVKADTGMHRLGFFTPELNQVWQTLSHCSWVAQPLVLASHLACADEPRHNYNHLQRQAFSSLAQQWGAPTSLYNSAALLSWPETAGDWIRPGIMLYGVSPFETGCGQDLGLRAVMELRTTIIALKYLKKDAYVGYGNAWQCPVDMLIGIAAIGYGDGYPRHAEAGTPVLVNGRRVPLIGRVSMDMICVDLREAPSTQIGDPVVLWGPSLPVEDIARSARTIPYQLLCNISPRVHFDYRDV